MLSLEEKKARLTTETYIRIVTTIDDLVDRGYIDPSLKLKALEKFIDDALEKEVKI